MRGFNRSKIVAVCIDDFITRVCCNNCLQDIKDASNRTAKESDASSKNVNYILSLLIQPRIGCSKYVYKMCIVDFEGI